MDRHLTYWWWWQFVHLWLFTPYFSAQDINGLVSRDPALMNKPFYTYDFMVLTYSAQYSKIKLCATCFCLREDFCKDRQCLHSDIWNTRISTRNRRISPKFSSNRQLQRALRGKEMVYIPGICWEPLIKHLKTSWWLSQAACLWNGTCRERSQVFPQTMWDEVMTGDGNFMHYPQKTELFAFLIKQKKTPTTQTLGSYFSITLSSSIHPGLTHQKQTSQLILDTLRKRNISQQPFPGDRFLPFQWYIKWTSMHIFVSPKQ